MFSWSVKQPCFYLQRLAYHQALTHPAPTRPREWRDRSPSGRWLPASGHWPAKFSAGAARQSSNWPPNTVELAQGLAVLMPKPELSRSPSRSFVGTDRPESLAPSSSHVRRVCRVRNVREANLGTDEKLRNLRTLHSFRLFGLASGRFSFYLPRLAKETKVQIQTTACMGHAKVLQFHVPCVGGRKNENTIIQEQLTEVLCKHGYDPP